MKSLNVVIATSNKISLKRMVDSISYQLSESDYLTLIYDTPYEPLKINTKASIITIKNSQKLGYWGHGSRTKWQDLLPGEYFTNGDDDDIYLPNAISDIKEACKERKLYLFKIINTTNDHSIWKYPILESGNIGTPCGVYPKIPNLPIWQPKRGGDFNFYDELSKRIEFEFVDKVIYKTRPEYLH